MQRNPLVVVMPVARMDWHLAIKCSAWIKIIQKFDAGFDLVFLCSEKLTEDERSQLLREVEHPNIAARVVIPSGVNEGGYTKAPNFMIKAALELAESEYPGRPMLWMEADCVPMHAGWLEEIAREYATCGKPFLGDHVNDPVIPHLTGNAVYPPDWRIKAPSLAKAIEKPHHGWDSQCAPETFPQSAKSRFIRQVWRPGPLTPLNWRHIVGDQTALFHQCKDGSLLDSLANGIILPSRFQLERSTYDADYPKGPPKQILDQSVEILYVTFNRDKAFLEYSLQAVKKFARGFLGVTICVPRHEEALFDWAKEYGKIVTYDERPGKGMLHHEVMICRADQLCPHASAILHMDADVMPWGPFTKDDYLPNGRPLMVRETYEQAGRHNPNRLKWQETTIKALGFIPEWETMVRHPNIHLREVYPLLRSMVEAHTKRDFDNYVLSCQNEFPQGFAEFPALGAVACRHFEMAYTMVNYERQNDANSKGIGHTGFQYCYTKGRDKMVETWSHGGIAPYRAWMDLWLDGRPNAYYLK